MPRSGNVLKPKGPKGPRAMKFYHSAAFCKIYYSHFIFEVITFLRKIQNHSEKLSNYGSFFKNWKEKPLPWNFEMKNWKEKPLLPKIVFWQKILISKTGRKNHYSQNLCFDRIFAWKEYNFLSGFLTNRFLNFCQECLLLPKLFGW